MCFPLGFRRNLPQSLDTVSPVFFESVLLYIGIFYSVVYASRAPSQLSLATCKA